MQSATPPAAPFLYHAIKKRGKETAPRAAALGTQGPAACDVNDLALSVIVAHRFGCYDSFPCGVTPLPDTVPLQNLMVVALGDGAGEGRTGRVRLTVVNSSRKCSTGDHRSPLRRDRNFFTAPVGATCGRPPPLFTILYFPINLKKPWNVPHSGHSTVFLNFIYDISFPPGWSRRGRAVPGP
jgi:hypothetical protein